MQPTNELVDLDRVAQNRHFETRETHESEADAQARREREAALAELERRKVWWTFVFALLLVATTFVGCLYLFVTGSPDDKKWSAGLMSAIVSGLVGYLVGARK